MKFLAQAEQWFSLETNTLLVEVLKKAERLRIDAFKLLCWRRLLRVPWTAWRSNQSILKKVLIFIGRTDAEAETPTLWPPDAKN